MRKSLLLLTALAFTTAAASAQTTAPTAAAAPQDQPVRPHHQPKSPEQSAQHHTRSLTKKLNLSADQQAKVYPIFLAEAQQTQTLKAGATSRKGMRQDMQALRGKQQTQLQAVLTPTQFAQYTAMQQERKAHRRAGKLTGKS